MKFVIIVTLTFMLLIPITAFGYGDGYFEYDYGKQVSQSPTICFFQPDDSRIDEQRWNNWYNDMKPAIDTWRSVLQSSGSGNWDITVVNVTLDKLELLNYTACDMYVQFVEKPYIENGEYANALGWWSVNTGNIIIVFLDSEFCGKEYNADYNIMVNTYCFKDTIQRSKMMASVLQHEFGHALGLGHYVSYDGVSMQKWYDTGIGYPSIMTPIPPNEELKKITQIDINEVRQIYGYQGFGKKIDSLTPIFNEPYVPEPVIPVAGITNIHITGSSVSKLISGDVPDTLYKRGEPLQIEIQKPNGFTESIFVKVSKTLKTYKYNLSFEQSSQEGRYTISLKFDGTVFKKIPINVSKNSVSANYASNVVSSKYLENIIIKENSNTYTVTSQLSSSYPSNQIRIIAENECPFKKQVFQQDFRFNTGKPITFSFSQSSIGKPSVCAIHFTITNFEGQVLDSIKAEYNPQTKQQNNFIDSDYDGDGVPDKDDKCPKAFGFEETDGCVGSPTKEKIDYSQKISLQNEVTLLQSKSYSEFQTLHDDVSAVQELLRELSSNSNVDENQINKAWNVLKSSQKTLDEIRERYQKGDNQIRMKLYDNAKTSYGLRGSEGQDIEDNLNEISKIITQVKKIEDSEETCFLWWCW